MVAEGYKETEIGIIPIEWEVAKLSEVCKFKQGIQIPIEEQDIKPSNDKIRFLRISDYTQNTDDIRYVSKDYSDYLISNDDIVMVRYGETAGFIGTNLSGVLANNLFSINPNKQITKRYLYTYMNDEKIYNYLKSLRAAGAMPAVSFKSLNIIKIPLPPLKEQEKIADILSTADEKIDAITSQIQKAETLKIGLLQKLLSEGIGHSEFKDSELGKIPVSWEVVKLSQVVSINPNSLMNSTNPDFEIEYIDIASIVETGTISETNLYKFSDAPSRARRIVNKNDILLSTVRPYLKSFSIVKENKDNLICSTGYAVLRAKEQTYYEYIYQFVLADVFMGQVDTMLVGSNYPAINSNDVKNIKLPFPPLEEQKQIADILSTADKKLEILRAKKEKYETLKKGLLQKLLSGEVRV